MVALRSILQWEGTNGGAHPQCIGSSHFKVLCVKFERMAPTWCIGGFKMQIYQIKIARLSPSSELPLRPHYNSHSRRHFIYYGVKHSRILHFSFITTHWLTTTNNSSANTHTTLNTIDQSSKSRKIIRSLCNVTSMYGRYQPYLTKFVHELIDYDW